MNQISGKKLFMAGLAAWVLLGLLDVFVWGPLAQVPGGSLPGTYVAIAESGELGWVLPWPILWAVLCVVVMLRVTREWRTRQPGIAQRAVSRRMVAAGGVLLAIGLLAVIYYFAAIPMALWISNHLPPFEGNDTPFFSATSAVALVATATGALLLLAARFSSRALQGPRATKMS